MENCEDINLENLTILSDIRCRNTDGLNLYRCQRAFIRGCYIVTGDDSIALAGNTKNVMISDTIAESSTNFVRIFIGIDAYLLKKLGIPTGDTLAERERNEYVGDISISNCRMTNGGCFATIISAYGEIKNIQFNNVSSYTASGDSGMFIAIQAEGKIRDVSVNNYNCEARGAATIIGTTQESIQNISFSNTRFLVNPRTKLFGNGMIDPVVNYWISEHTPYNFYVRNASNINLRDVQILWGKDDLSDIAEVGDPNLRKLLDSTYNVAWRKDMNPSVNFPAINASFVNNLTLSGVTCLPHGDSEPIRLQGVAGFKTDDQVQAKQVKIIE